MEAEATISDTLSGLATASSSLAHTDASTDTQQDSRPRAWPSKLFKASDLPLDTEQKEAVDKLMQSYKRRGDYDAVRKDMLDRFYSGVCEPGEKKCDYYFAKLTDC